MDIKLAQEYLGIIDPSGNGWLGTRYQPGTDRAEGRNLILPHSDVMSRYAEYKGNVWICPAPRTSHTRLIKGDAKCSWVVWCDYDSQLDGTNYGKLTIPWQLQPYAWKVASGTPGNYHVYLLLERPVSWQNVTKLNADLRTVLHGDSKFADNALLRLPGTINAKNGRQVAPQTSADRIRRVGASDVKRILMDLTGASEAVWRMQRDVLSRAASAAGNLNEVDVPNDRFMLLPRAVRVDLLARNFRVSGRHDRSAARFGFWREFFKADLSIDEAYSLLMFHDHPSTEAWDWEADLARCWSKYERA